MDFDSDAFAKMLFQAAQDKNGFLLLAMALLAAVFAAKRFGVRKFPYLGTHAGSAILTVVGSAVGAIATALAAGQPMGMPLLFAALKVAGPTVAALLFAAFHEPTAGDIKAEAKVAGAAAAEAVPPAALKSISSVAPEFKGFK